MRFQSYFNTAVLLIRQYDGSIPLAHFLKQYFAQHKKHGSNDRKFISHLCYTYYRIGQVLKAAPVEERLKIALFICSEQPGDWHVLYDANWLNRWSNQLTERLAFIQSGNPAFSVTDIFPWKNQISDGIDVNDFTISHLVQPDLFIRIRSGNEKKVLQKLTGEKISFTQLSDDCLALPNASKIDSLFEIDKEIVIQDYSSQRIADCLKLIPNTLSLTPVPAWDCCAASGGKSILAKDILGNIFLTASDIRPSILKNLQQRFRNAGIKSYHSFVCDLTKTIPPTQSFKLIICDAPCSGSGTWSRTPEQLYFFSAEQMNEYAVLQKKIVHNVMPRLEKGGYFLYITCSVFTAENETVVEMLQHEYPLQLIKTELLKGYGFKADSMFVGLFELRVEGDVKR